MTQVIRLTLAFALLIMTGCTAGSIKFPIDGKAQDDLLEQIDIVSLSETTINNYATSYQQQYTSDPPKHRPWEYLIGVGDILTVVVFDHAELTVPGGAENGVTGFRVRSDGFITYPFIGQVQARGRRPEAVRAEIAERLGDFIPSPQVDLRVTEFNSQSVIVTGEVKAPTKQALTAVPLTMIEAITAAGGVSSDGDGERVTLRRAGRSYRLSIGNYLYAGGAASNPILRHGDVINVPRRTLQEAFILGEVVTPGTVDLSKDTISLTQALTRQQGLDEIRADARGIFVFRVVSGRTTVYQLDVSNAAALLLGTRFILHPNDVIYVVRSPLTRWNDAITGILPTVSAVQTAGSVTN